MPFVPSRDGPCFYFIGNVDVCPFSLSRSPRCSRFVFLAFSSLSYFLALIVWASMLSAGTLSMFASAAFRACWLARQVQHFEHAG